MKKLLCGILAVVSILALLTACGETENVTTTTTTQASTIATTKSVTTTQKPTTTTTTTHTTTATERATGTIIDPEENPALAAELLNLLRINTVCASELFFDGQLVNGVNDGSYEFANSEQFPNLKALEDFLSEGYIEPIVKYLLCYYSAGKPEYIDIDGKLAQIPVFDGADDVFHWTDEYGGKITDIEMFDDYVLFEGIVYSGYGERFDIDDEYPIGQVWTLRAVKVDGKWKLDPLVPHYVLEEWYYKEYGSVLR